MILFFAAGSLQTFVVFECLLRRILGILIPGQRSAVGVLSDKTALAVSVSGIGKIISIPLQCFVGVLSVGFSLLMACGILMLLAVAVAENSSPMMSLILSVYNMAIGPVVNALLDMFSIVYGLFRSLIPIYNTIVYILTQLIIQIVGPWVWEFADKIPAIFSNAAFAITSLILTIVDWVQHISKCANSSPMVPCQNFDECGAVFVQRDLNCFANPAYLSVDLMTSGIYTRRIVITLQEMFTDWEFKFSTATIVSDFCSIASILLNLATYPLLDFNLYKVVHNLVNIFFYGSSSLTMGTMRRCDYVRQNNFDSVAIAVACTPDVSPLVSLISEMFRALGRLVDNWLNQGASVALELITGKRDECDILSLRQSVIDVSAVYDESIERIRIVGLSDTVLGITNGISCMFRAPMQKAWSSFLWPFHVDVKLGIAAVQLSGDSMARTGMLGCRCYDSDQGIKLLCATVAMFADGQDDDGMYNTSTIHNIRFEGIDLTGTICARTLVKVSSLRFARRRLAKSAAFGKDVDASDAYDTFGTNKRVASNGADASIYVQPLCGGSDTTCVPMPTSCYPWCMGLHIAENMAQNISILKASDWEDYVSVRQTDCGVELNDGYVECDETEADEVVVETTQNGQYFPARCGLQRQVCVSNNVVNTNVRITSAVFANNPVIAQKISTGPVTRHSKHQPFAVAGDVMLTLETNEETGQEYVTVSRIYDGGGGLFGVGEQLTLIRNQRPVPVFTCEIVDSECASQALDMGGIVRPRSYYEYPGDRIPAINSRWAIHWAINPEIGVLNGIVNFCRSGEATTTVIVESSWGPARVWTMKTMRAVDFAMPTQDTTTNDNNNNNDDAVYSTSYMVVPGFIDAKSFDCKIVTNLKIVDLEYLNSENILVTVLMGRPVDIDPVTGDVCDTCVKQYTYYYAHPERHDCIQPSQDFQTKYTCWRSEEEGPWPSDAEVPLFGYTCPAVQRMPPLGGLIAEMGVLPVVFLKLIVESIMVVSAAIAGGGWQGLSQVMRPRFGKLTFHSMIDSAGANLLGVDDLNYCIEQSSLFMAQSLIKLSGILDGRPGADFVRNVMLGTAKVVQYSDGLIPAGDPISRQISVVHNIPSITVVSSIGTMITSMGSPGALTIVGQMMVSSGRVTKLNLMLMRRILIRLLRASDIVDAIVGILLAAIYESKKDFDDFFSAMRMQCQGLSEVIGNTNPFAKLIRHACHLSPTSMEFVLTIIRVILVEYSVMSCVCKLSTADRLGAQTGVLQNICLKRFSPASQQAWMLGLLFSGDNTVRRDMCFASMDGANRRLLTALDGFLSRLYKISQNLPEGLEFLISLISHDKSGCDAYLLSPYVMSLIPEPVDYFMGCLKIPDCRVKCLSEFEAFENLYIQASNTVGVPRFKLDQVIEIDSPIFDPFSQHEGSARPPFELFAQLEFTEERCQMLCQNEGYGRCFATAGLDDNSLIKLAYFCIPLDITMSVYSLMTFDYTHSASVVDMFVLSGFKTDGDWILIAEHNDVDSVLKLVIPGQDIMRTILSTDARSLVTSTSEQSVFGNLQSISSVKVIPSMTNNHKAYVVVWGQKVVAQGMSQFSYLENMGLGAEIERQNVCMLLTIDTSQQNNNLGAVNVGSSSCPDFMMNGGEEDFTVICMQIDCFKQLLLPTSQQGGTVIKIRTLNGASALNYATSVNDVAFKISFKQKSQLLGSGVVAPLYSVQSGRAVLRRVLVSTYTTSKFEKEVIELLMCNNNQARMASWISVVTINLAGQKVTLSEKASLKTNISMSMYVNCSIDNCVGCYGDNGVNGLLQDELASRCYAAQECGVTRCAGTLVNMRKPLCNIGKVGAKMLDVYRTTLGGVWQSIAQQIVMFVELSASRRQQYELAWPDEYFMTGICSTKDTTVHLSSIFTSLIGAIGISINQKRVDYMSSRVGQVDSKFNARFTMSLMAMTNFLSSVLLWPVYNLIALRKMISCSTNSAMAVFQNVFAPNQGGMIELYFGSKEIQQVSDSTLGVCLTAGEEELMRDPARETPSITKRIANLLIGVRQLSLQQLLQLYGAAYDTVMAYGIGVITALEDVLSTADEENCRLPVVTNGRIGQCACGDDSYYIPSPQKQQKFVDQAWWCSGLMLLTDSNGDDLIIWNPYSLHELLMTPGLDNHVKCLSSTQDCSQPPTLPALTQQGVHVMQVITQCRSNYQQNQWDDASVLYSLFSPREWQDGNFEGATTTDDEFTNLRLKIRGMSQVFSLQGQIDATTYSCLRAALEFSNTKHRCHVPLTSNKNYQFVYVRTIGEPTYAMTDACRVFTGSAQRFNNNASFTPYVWSASSPNRVPVATNHLMESSSEDRTAVATTRLQVIFDEMLEFFKHFDVESEYNSVEARAFSVEGDQLHQLIDCIMIGPFASAEIPKGFSSSASDTQIDENSDTFQGSVLYHRKSRLSREFEKNSNGITGGSQLRKKMLSRAIEILTRDEASEALKNAAKDRVNQIKKKMLYTSIGNLLPDSMMCPCPSSSSIPFSLSCCSYANNVNDIQFPLRTLFSESVYLRDEILLDLLQHVVDSDLLTKDVWVDRYFMPEETILSTEDREEMHQQYMFDNSKPIRKYSLEDVASNIGGRTLWDECTRMLSASFFTMPMLDNLEVDVNTIYDPMEYMNSNNDSPSTKYLHAMERAVEQILARSKRDSPVYWSHIHRYVPSDSVWCERHDLPLQQHNVRHTTSNPPQKYDNMVLEDIILGPNLAETVFPAHMLSKCFCGWSGPSTRCGLHTVVCSIDFITELNSVHVDDWNRICLYGYETQDDLIFVVRILDMFPGNWMPECVTGFSSTTWGLMSEEQLVLWFSGNVQSAWDIDLYTLAVQGPNGMRLAHYGNYDVESGKNIFLHEMRSNATGIPAINLQYNHTIGQPVCASTLSEYLTDDLTQYFKNVLFPMAHSVHDAPASVMCSRWVIEFALQLALTQIYTSSDDERVQEQQATALTWQKRCSVHLERLSTCELRNVFAVFPDDALIKPEKCNFGSVETYAGLCSSLFYFTPNCLVRCNSDFFDPCKCNSGCIFTGPDNCLSGKLRSHFSLLQSDAAKLGSLTWPDAILENELGTAGDDVNSQLKNVQTYIRTHSTKIPLSDIYSDMSNLILSRDVEEGQIPQGFCEDLVDYWADDAQHPVGYHPTRTCRMRDTNIRGFDSWMFGTEDGDWVIDQIRMRNATLSSTVYGTAHHVCDASAYGAAPIEWNDLRLQTKWDPTHEFDPVVPPTKPMPEISQMWRLSKASDSAFDVPLSDSTWNGLHHSLGLIRDWYFHPNEETNHLNHKWFTEEAWPHWQGSVLSSYRLTQGGTNHDDYTCTRTKKVCSPPPISTCQTCSDCCPGDCALCELDCLKASSGRGVCMHRDTCFMHSHCQGQNKMCSGEGKCVDAHVSVTSQSTQKLAIQLYSAGCKRHAVTTSRFQNAPEFVKIHGLCQYKDWWGSRLLREHGKEAFPFLEYNDETVSTPLITEKRLSDLLKMLPHACERTYQHIEDYNLCTSEDITPPKKPGSQTGTTEIPQEYSVMHTGILDSDTRPEAAKWQMCDVFADEVYGFLSPYSVSNVHDLLRVPETIQRCSRYSLCPQAHLYIRGQKVAMRRVLNIEITSTTANAINVIGTSRSHCFYDTETCSGVGYSVAHSCKEAVETNEKRCVVDVMVVPMLWVVFGVHDSSHLQESSGSLSKLEFLSVSDVISKALSRIQSHCPLAFTDRVGLSTEERILEIYHLLIGWYNSGKSQSIIDASNQLFLAVFGINEQLNVPMLQLTEHTYMKHSSCARYVLMQMNILSLKLSHVYPKETLTGLQHNVPGQALYITQHFQVIEVSFMWMWKCSILSGPSDGGAAAGWMKDMSNAQNPKFPQCANLQVSINDAHIYHSQSTMLQRFLFDSVIYAYKAPQPLTWADRVLFDIDNILIQIISRFQIIAIQEDMHYVCSQRIIKYARNVLFDGNRMELLWPTWTLRNWIERGIVTVRSDTSLYQPYDTSFPVHRFTALIDMHARLDDLLNEQDFSAETGVCKYTSVQMNCLHFFEDLSSCRRFHSDMEQRISQYNDNLPTTENPNAHGNELKNVLYLVLLIFEHETHKMHSFIATGDSQDISPDEESTYLLNFFASTPNQINISYEEFEEVAKYNSFMRNKLFQCTEGRILDYAATTNSVHLQMKTCVEKMKRAGGWNIGRNEDIHYDLPAVTLLKGFFPAFIQPQDDDEFLSGLFSFATSHQNSVADALCFSGMFGPELLNPYWANGFDFETGCDISKVDGAVYFLDAFCSTREGSLDELNCPSTLKDYTASVSQNIRPFCTNNQGDTFMRKNVGTLTTDKLPLCTRLSSENLPGKQCDRLFGTLYQYTGESVSDLTPKTYSKAIFAGVWNEENKIILGSPLQRADSTYILKTLDTDIGGHSFGFEIDQSGVFFLRCMSLGNEKSPTCPLSARDWRFNWMNELERQHQFLMSRWDIELNAQQDQVIDWQCPLQYMSAFTTNANIPQFTVNAARNAVRFPHITGKFSYAHPTIKSAFPLPTLRPGRFVSDFITCVGSSNDLTNNGACRDSNLLERAIMKSRRFDWQTLELLDRGNKFSTCSRILDWPHESYILRDRNTLTFKSTEWCNVYSRLNVFAMRYIRVPLKPPDKNTASTSKGGVCRMGRLKRLPLVASNRLHDTHVSHRCWVDNPTTTEVEENLSCVTTFPETLLKDGDSIGRRTVTQTQFKDNAISPVKQTPTPPYTLCSACDLFPMGKIATKDGSIYDLPSSSALNQRQLSVGKFTVISTERMVAHAIRKELCGNKKLLSNCVELPLKLDSSFLQRGKFLQALLKRPRDIFLQWTEVKNDVTVSTSQIEEYDDTLLWSRPWVFCPLGHEASKCLGTITKSDWVNSDTRTSTCFAAIESAQAQMPVTSTSTRVLFCMLTANTEMLCEKITTWRDRILTTLCRASGVCPEDDFFYTPATYTPGNQEFVRDTVEQFYIHNGQSCPSATDTIEEQILSNEKKIVKCAANYVHWIKVILQLLRRIRESALRIAYYYYSIQFAGLQILAAALTASIDVLEDGTMRLMTYIGLMLEAVMSIVVQLFLAVARIIFGGGAMEKIEGIIRELCKFVNAFMQKFVVGFLCKVILKAFQSAMYLIAGVLDTISWLHEDIKRAANQMRKYGDDAVNGEFCVFKEFECDPEDYDDSNQGRGTNVVPTRCWSTYVTFFGDTKQLSCTAADTCRKSLTSTDLVVCGTCNAVADTRRDYGCSPITKYCTCDVPKLQRTSCLTNLECADQSSNCRFVDEEITLSTGYVSCQSCQSRPMCLFQDDNGQHSTVGVCVCPLFDTAFSECSALQWRTGQPQMAEFARPCLYMPSRRYVSTTSWTVQFGEIGVVSCQSLDTVYCVKVNGVASDDIYWMLGVARIGMGRRLLNNDNFSSYQNGKILSSHNALCADALAQPDILPQMHAECVRWCHLSASLLQEIEFIDSDLDTQINACAFATVDDVIGTFRSHPVILPTLLAHPDVAITLLINLSPLNTLKRAQQSIARAFRMIRHLAEIDNITSVLQWNTTPGKAPRLYSTDTRVVPVQVVHILQTTWTLANLTLPFLRNFSYSHELDTSGGRIRITASTDRILTSHTRRLLFSEVLQGVDASIQELENLRQSYSQQIGDIFNYRYAEESTAYTRAAWLYDSGPDKTLQKTPCKIVVDLTNIVVESFFGLSVALKSQYAQSRPATNLGDAIRVVFPKNTVLSDGDVDSTEKEQDTFAWILARIVRYTFGCTGISPNKVFASVQSVVEDFKNSFECDYLAIQTCNKWKIHLIHAIIIYGVLFAAAWTLFSSLGMGFLFSLATPLLILIVLGTCYNYYWSCFPMIPVCLVEDFVSSIRSVLPRELWVPAALTQPTCTPHSTLPSPSCIKRCSSDPVAFTSWMAPVAWWAAELDISSTAWVRWLPGVSEDQYILEQQLRLSIYDGDDNDLKSANRICTLFTLHMTLPYIFLGICMFLVMKVGVGIMMDVFQNFFMTMTFLIASVTTE